MRYFTAVLVLLPLLFSSCYYIVNINEDPPPSFTEIKGIRYTEVYRRFDNGLSFNDQGFQLEPEWDIYFSADDTIRIYSPERKQYMPYRIFHSHKALFHFARDWFRVLHVSPDSLVLQVMELEARVVKDELSKVFMTLYSEDYISNRLKTTKEELRRPTQEDSLFIKYRAIQANSDIDSAFAARNPVEFESKSKILQVEKLPAAADPYLEQISRSEEYMNPEYRIVIDKAYEDFQYSFSAVVDHRGRLHFRKFLIHVMPEFVETKTKVVKGIIDVYLRNLMIVRPGTTLGFPHSSVVNVHVTGRKT